ncbi:MULTISPECIES: hypothetical protein [Lactobacillaceae]|nr:MULTISPECIES: hypothetical protein [Lactobacillaceae]GEP72008.1 hypothetical protein LRA02_08760 [Lentilactobacillus rapi]
MTNEQKNCPYCHNTAMSRVDLISDSLPDNTCTVWIYQNSLMAQSFYTDVDLDYTSTKRQTIHYCPMCGRQLDDE